MAKNVNEIYKNMRGFGDKVSDWMTNFVGSWAFISLFGIFFGVWVSLNVYGWVSHWDPFPFILLNLTLSALAAIQAPIILMSQKRADQKSKIKADIDFETNQKAELEIQDMQKDLEEIKKLIKANTKT